MYRYITKVSDSIYQMAKHCSIKIIVHPLSEKLTILEAHQYQIYSDVPDLDKFHDASETFVVIPIWPGPMEMTLMESGVQGGK